AAAAGAEGGRLLLLQRACQQVSDRAGACEDHGPDGAPARGLLRARVFARGGEFAPRPMRGGVRGDALAPRGGSPPGAASCAARTRLEPYLGPPGQLARSASVAPRAAAR